MSAKSKPRKSWQEKLADSKGLPKVEEITDKMSKRWGTGTVVIPAPEEVDKIMRKVPSCALCFPFYFLDLKRSITFSLF